MTFRAEILRAVYRENVIDDGFYPVYTKTREDLVVSCRFFSTVYKSKKNIRAFRPFSR